MQKPFSSNHPSSPYIKTPMKLQPPAVDFNYNYDTTPTPYVTAPSSPQSTIPFFWEEKPGIPKENNHDNCFQDYDTDFAFRHLERHSISAADELFDCGKIKPLKPPPRLHFPNDSSISSKPPKRRFKDTFSPPSNKNDFDPFSEALNQTPCVQTQRGRDRTTKHNRCKASRSLSPFRLADIVTSRKNQSPEAGVTWYNKWNLKNLLLFRSASDGSVTTRKESLNKYTVLQKNETVSFRRTDGGGSMKVSADGISLTAAEEMRRKTSLPYKSGLMGCLRFHQNAGSVLKE